MLIYVHIYYNWTEPANRHNNGPLKKKHKYNLKPNWQSRLFMGTMSTEFLPPVKQIEKDHETEQIQWTN